MQTTKNSTSKHLMFLNQKSSPFTKQHQVKSSKNLNISLGANQSIHTFNPHFNDNKSVIDQKGDYNRGTKIRSKEDEGFVGMDLSRKLNTIAFQNEKLKEENEYLRKELDRVRKQKEQIGFGSKQKYRVVSREHSKQRGSGDLRGTIKKEQIESGESKQLRIKLQILSKQCKMYEQIIDKMQSTIRRLTDENKVLQSKHNKPQQRHSQKDIRRQEFELLKQRVGMIMREYSELESKMHSNQLEWVIWKEQWITQKNIYLNKIKQLEAKIKDTQKHIQ